MFVIPDFARRVWTASRNLVHVKWESVERRYPGGTHVLFGMANSTSVPKAIRAPGWGRDRRARGVSPDSRLDPKGLGRPRMRCPRPRPGGTADTRPAPIRKPTAARRGVRLSSRSGDISVSLLLIDVTTLSGRRLPCAPTSIRTATLRWWPTAAVPIGFG
jgi:hypothetical protein